MQRKEKETFVEDFSKQIEVANNFFLTDYRGLKTIEMNDLRGKIRNNGCELKVIKNRLAKITMKNLKLEKILDYFKGPTAIILEKKNIISGAKVLVDFSKEHDNLKIKAGVFNGNLISKDEIKNLASIPSREVLLANLARGLKIPIFSFANILNGIMRNLAFVLEAVRCKRSEGGDTNGSKNKK